MKKLDKNSQIIKFIVERLSGILGRTHLIKLIYLADYHSRRLFGKPISTFDYYWDKRGPFDKEFYTAIEILKEYIREDEVNFPRYKGYIFHNEPKQIEYNKLTRYDLYMLEYVIKNYGKENLQSLLEDVVYKTVPMVEVIEKEAYKSRLPMEKIDNLDKALYEGLKPENIIDGEMAILEGKTRSLEEVFSVLQG